MFVILSFIRGKNHNKNLCKKDAEAEK